jgi:hypothetical protein
MRVEAASCQELTCGAAQVPTVFAPPRARARTEDLGGASAQRQKDRLVAVRLHAQLVLL